MKAIDRNLIIQGIYRVYNIVTGKSYIGRSVDINSRLGNHFSELKRGGHYNKSLQSDWNDYGEENYDYEILLEIHDENIFSRVEKDFINKYKKDGVYNKTDPLFEYHPNTKEAKIIKDKQKKYEDNLDMFIAGRIYESRIRGLDSSHIKVDEIAETFVLLDSKKMSLERRISSLFMPDALWF